MKKHPLISKSSVRNSRADTGTAVSVKAYKPLTPMPPAEHPSKNKFTIIANWKMHLGDRHGLNLAAKIAAAYKKLKNPGPLVLCPPFTVLLKVHQLVGASAIKVGAQDVSDQSEGAHTGEVSAHMLLAAGCSYVLVGHSERRTQLGETDDIIRRKLNRAVASGLTPVLCVGETWDQRQEQQSELVVIKQVQEALSGLVLPPNRHLFIAYEPVWAIGSGQTVPQDEAAHMAQLIRHLVADGDHFNFTGVEPQQQISILYGGSVAAENIAQFNIPGIISGALVGGASLELASLMSLLKAVR